MGKRKGSNTSLVSSSQRRPRKPALIFASLLLVVTAAWADITTLPTITVVGERQGGGEALVCSSGACFDTAQEEALIAYMEWLQMYDEVPQEDVPLNGERFCQTLALNKPDGCSLGNPPPSPGITVPGNPSYAPNGCGTGGTGGWFQNAVLQVISSNSYSGNIDAPYPGVSFLSACNAHDTCWAAGLPRATCDNAFQQSTQAACSAISDPQGTCSGFASLYHGALSTTNPSHSAYATSVANRQCALWALDMRENDCDD